MSEELRVLVLGPVEVERAGELLPIGGRRARSILAALVISLRHAVSDDRLIEAAWGDEPPESARASMQSHISRLRRALGHDVVQRHDHSYVLDVDPGQVDACVFERTLAEAAEAFPSDPVETLQLCRRALEVWRGPPFGDLGEADFALPETVRLEELRVDATELFLEATIAVERPGLAVPALRAAVTENPYREKMWYLLVRGLALEGRRVEALRELEQARLALADVGLELTVDLRELEQQIVLEDESVRPHLTG